MSRSVAPADPATLGHDGKELLNVLLPDSILDGDHNGTAAVPNLQCELRLAPAVKWFHIGSLILRQYPVEAEKCSK
jgi:hypothetical protein